jgi:glyoxylase-like metal-dependent hydrolase (beta-lactamase superfamily II)
MPIEQTIEIGQVSVVSILESTLSCPPEVWINDGDPQAGIAAAREWCEVTIADDGWLTTPVRCYLVRSAGQTILVDTGQGADSPFVSAIPGWRVDAGDLIADLRAAGVDPADVDYVVMTHAHPDHTGWNLQTVEGITEPTFPNARHLLCELDWVLTEQFSDLARPLVELRASGALELVAADREITNEVRLLESHGHTPGHVCVAIESDGVEALILGDVVHHKVSLTDPEAREALDNDEAVATRQTLYQRLSGSDTLILASHFEAPAAGYLRPRAAGYQFDESP